MLYLSKITYFLSFIWVDYKVINLNLWLIEENLKIGSSKNK